MRLSQLCVSDLLLAAWCKHYTELAADVTGHSCDWEHWQHLSETQTLPPLDESNTAITIQDVWAALGKMARYKAPGQDGIPVDFIRACLLEQPTTSSPQDPSNESFNTHCTTLMSTALCSMLNSVFMHGIVPKEWSMSTVVSIPKKRDLHNMNNYQGISLMSTTLKVLTVILSDSINRVAKSHNLFHPAQAGFRHREECVTQAICVVDVLQRRQIACCNLYGLQESI